MRVKSPRHPPTFSSIVSGHPPLPAFARPAPGALIRGMHDARSAVPDTRSAVPDDLRSALPDARSAPRGSASFRQYIAVSHEHLSSISRLGAASIHQHFPSKFTSIQ